MLQQPTASALLPLRRALDAPFSFPSRGLVVSNDREVVKTLASSMAVEGLGFEQASSPEAAWSTLTDHGFSVVFVDLDFGSPIMGLLASLRKAQAKTSVVAIAHPDHRSLAVHALRLGALGYALKPVAAEEVALLVVQARRRDRLHQSLAAAQKKNLCLQADLVAQEDEFHGRELEIAARLVRALEMRSLETSGHVERIGLFSAELGAELGWPAEGLEKLRLAASLHDLGKIALPDAVLHKAGPLSREEYALVKTHPELGAAILGEAQVPFLQIARQIALSHHERWDGKGYPHRLRGKDIPLGARIVAVVDVYDALVHERVYRAAMPEAEALALLTEERGRHFDPEVLDAFMDLLPLIRDLRRQVEAA